MQLPHKRFMSVNNWPPLVAITKGGFFTGFLSGFLYQLRQVGLLDVAELVVDDDLLGLFSILGAEHHDALAVQQEGVHVGNRNAGLRERLYSIGATAGLVVQLQGEDVGEGNGNAAILQLFVGAEGFTTNETVDAVLCRVGDS